MAGGGQTGDGMGIKELIEEFAGPDTRMDLAAHHVTEANGLALLGRSGRSCAASTAVTSSSSRTTASRSCANSETASGAR